MRTALHHKEHIHTLKVIVFLLALLLSAYFIEAQIFENSAITGGTIPDQVFDEDTNLTLQISEFFTDTSSDPLNYTAAFLPPNPNVSVILTTGWQDEFSVGGSVNDLFTNGSLLYVVHGANLTKYDGIETTTALATNISGELRTGTMFLNHAVVAGDDGEVWFFNDTGTFNFTNSTTLSTSIRSIVELSSTLYLIDNETVYFRNASINNNTNLTQFYYSVVANAPVCHNNSAAVAASSEFFFSCGGELLSHDGATFSNESRFSSYITSLTVDGVDVYIGLANGSVVQRTGSTNTGLGGARSSVTDIAVLSNTVYVGTNASLEYDNSTNIRPVESKSSIESGLVYLEVFSSSVFTGTTTGFVDSFNGNHSTAATVFADTNYNTDQSSGVTIAFNASDGISDSHVETVDITISAVNDAPTFLGPDIQEIDILEDTNYTFNINSLFSDVEEASINLTYTPLNTPTNFVVTYDNATGNLTFVPSTHFDDTEQFIILANDSLGNSSQSNSFIIDVEDVPDDINNLQNISNFTWLEDTILRQNLSDFYVDPDGEQMVYDFQDQSNNQFTIELDRSTGALNITPPQDFAGNATVNFTFTDFFGSQNFSEVVTMFVTEVPDGPRYNESSPISNVTWAEDTVNTSLNIANSFSDLTHNITGYSAFDDRLQRLCHLENENCTIGSAPLNASNIVVQPGKINSGLFMNGTSVLSYNISSDLTTTRGTVEVWVQASQASTDTGTYVYLDSRNETGFNGLVVYRNSTQLMARIVGAADNDTDLLAYQFDDDSFGNNKTHHIALTYGPGTGGLETILYLDGINVSNQSRAPHTSSMGERLYIGTNSTGGQQAGAIFDELRIFNVTQSAAVLDNDYQFEAPMLSLSIINATGAVTLVPQVNWSGTAYHRFRAIDGDALEASSPEIEFTVTNVNDRPFITTTLGTLTITEDVPSNNAFDLDDHFDDLDNRTLIFGSSNTGNVIVAIDEQNNVNLTPEQDFFGNTTVTFNATDGNFTVEQTFILVVDAENDPLSLVTVTPSEVQNGTVSLFFFTSSVESDPVNVTVQFSIDGGQTWFNATGPKLANLSSSNSTNRILPTADSFVSSAFPGTNFGTNSSLEVGSDGASVSRSFLRFSVPPAAPSMVQRGTLNVFQRVANGEARTVGVFDINQSFDESNVTFNNAPGNVTRYGTALIGGGEEYKVINITDLVQLWVNQSSNTGMMVRDLDEPPSLGVHIFGSREYIGNSTPYLEIFYNGTEHEFLWDSTSDINFTDQDQIVINVTVDGTNVSSLTMNFSVHNNNPPVLTGGNTSISIDEDEEFPLNLSQFFSDSDPGQTLTFSITNFSTNITLVNDIDVIGSEFYITQNSTFQGSPVAVYDGAEKRVAFVDFLQGDADIVYQRYSATNTLTKEVQLTLGNDAQTQPSLVRGGGADVYLAWKDTSTDLGNIQLTKLNGSDEVIFTINVTTQGSEQRSPTLHYYNDSVYVFWEDARNSDWQLFYARVNTTGGIVTSDTALTGESGNETQAVTALDTAGNTYVVWTKNEDQLQYAILNASGQVSEVLNITDVSQHQSEPTITVDTNDLAHVVWRGNRSTDNATDLFYIQLNITNSSFMRSVTNDTTSRLLPVLGSDDQDRLYVVYQEGAGAASDIVFQRLNTTGYTIYERNVSREANLQVNPALAMTGDSKKFVLWQHEDSDDNVKALEILPEEGRFIVSGAANFAGNGTFDTVATDSFALANLSFNVTIAAVNDPPVYGGPSSFSVLEDSFNDTINLSQLYSDVEGGNITFNVSSSVNLSVALVNDTQLNITANATNFVGTQNVTIVASDGTDTRTTTVDVNVIGVNDAPTLNATISDQAWAIATNASIDLTAHFLDVDGDSLTFNNTAAANITVTINTSTGVALLVSDPGFFGTRTIVFNASDGTNVTNSNTVTLSVQLFSVFATSTIDGTVVNGTFGNISGVLNSTIINATFTNVTSNHSTVDNSTLIDTTIAHANVSNGVLFSGLLYMFNGTLYDAGSSGAANLTDVVNYAPSAAISASSTSVTTDEVFTLDASSSTDANINSVLNDNLTYYWDFGDGTNASGVNVSKNYSSASSFTVRLNVTDRFGKEDSTTVAITVSSPSSGGGSSGGGGGGSSSSSSSGGGGGGGGVIIGAKTTCDESWTCSDWSACIGGVRTRTCSEQNACGTYELQPQETETCDSSSTDNCFNGVLDGDEEDVDCGGSCSACTTEEVGIPPQLEQPEEIETLEEPSAFVFLVESAKFYFATATPAVLWMVFALIGVIIFAAGALEVVHVRHSRERHSEVEKLAKYIGDNRSLGRTDSLILRALQQAGYAQKLIDEAFHLGVHRSLVDYAVASLAAGYTLEQIAAAMIKSGWHKTKVKKAVKHAKKKHKERKKKSTAYSRSRTSSRSTRRRS